VPYYSIITVAIFTPGFTYILTANSELATYTFVWTAFILFCIMYLKVHIEIVV
jgi:hypothetical protein